MLIPDQVKALNRSLGEALGMVSGLHISRFAWCYAPDMPYLFYAKDDRTVLKRSWAYILAPSGGDIGRVWVLAAWRETQVKDHYGYGAGVRLALMHDAEYKPFLETALLPGQLPDAEINQFYISKIGQQLSVSAEQIGATQSFDGHMAEYAYRDKKNADRFTMEHRERTYEIFDNFSGAFGNLEPGKRDGYFAFQNCESGPESDAKTTPA